LQWLQQLEWLQLPRRGLAIERIWSRNAVHTGKLTFEGSAGGAAVADAEGRRGRGDVADHYHKVYEPSIQKVYEPYYTKSMSLKYEPASELQAVQRSLMPKGAGAREACLCARTT